MGASEQKIESQTAIDLRRVLDRVDGILQNDELWRGRGAQTRRHELRMALDQVHTKLLKLSRANHLRRSARDELVAAYRQLRAELDNFEERRSR